MCLSARKLRNMRPDPTSSTKHSATSATTTALRSSDPPAQPARPAAGSQHLRTHQAGPCATPAPVRKAPPRPDPRSDAERQHRGVDRESQSRRGRLAGAIASKSRIPAQPMRIPEAIREPPPATPRPASAGAQPPPVRAHSGAHREIAPAQRGPHQKQVRHIRAGDQQQKDHRAHQRQNRRPRLRREIALHGLDAEPQFRPAVSRFGGAALFGDSIGLRLRPLDGCAWT